MEVNFRVTCLQCLGSGMFITDPNFSDPDSESKIFRILDPDPINQGWKKPGFFLKTPAQWVFLGFLGFFGFFGFFCPDERVFRVFFSFTNTFGCIQTLNYNHSYLLNSFS